MSEDHSLEEEKRDEYQFDTSLIQGDCLMNEANYLIMQGGKGGGKTAAMLLKFLMHVGKGWGDSWNGIIISKRDTSLKNVVSLCEKLCRRHIRSYDKVEYKVQFPGGEKLIFVNVEDGEAFQDKVQGGGYAFGGMDESSLWPDDEVFEHLSSTLRTPDKPKGKIIPTVIFLTANPTTVNHWMYKRFVLGRTSGVTYIEKGLTQCQYHVVPEDNEAIMSASGQYIQQLSNMSNKQLRDSYLYGLASDETDLVFSHAWSHEHNVVRPFVLPHSWKKNISMDWGFMSPFSVGWWAESDGSSYIDADGNTIPTRRGDLFRIKEYYGARAGLVNVGLKKQFDQVIQEIKHLDEWNVSDCIIDRTAIAGELRPRRMSLFRSAGITAREACNVKGSRIRTLHKVLRMMINAAHKDGPGLYIFDTCRDFIRLVPSLKSAKRNRLMSVKDINKDYSIEDVDTTKEDHIYDEARYRIAECADPYGDQHLQDVSIVHSLY